MADVSYSVEILYHSRGKIDSGLDSAKSKGTELVRTLTSGAASATGAFNAAFDSIAGAAITGFAAVGTAASTLLAVGVSRAVKEMFSFNDQMERAQISLAAIAQSGGLADSMGRGMQMSGTIIAQMRKDARELPGEFKDLQNIMVTIANSGMHAGKGFGQIEKFAARGMVAAEILHVPQQVAARELAMILEGNARHNQPLANRLNLGDLKAFNKLAPDVRFARAESALTKLVDPAMETMKNSWQSIKTTAIDTIRQSIGLVGGPLFSRVKDLVKSFNDMPDVAKERWRDFGIKVGMQLVNAFDQGKAAIMHWFPIMESFAENMYSGFRRTFSAIEPMIKSAVGYLERFMKDPNAFNKLEHLVGSLIALRVGTGVLSMGLGGLTSLLPAMGAGSALGGASGLSLAAVAPVAAAAASALALLAVGADGATHILLEGSNRWHNGAVENMTKLSKHMAGIGVELAKSKNALQPAFDAIGAFWLGGITFWTGVLEGAIYSVNRFGQSLEAIARWVDVHAWGKTPILPEVPGVNTTPAYEYPGFVKRFGGNGEAETPPMIVNHNTTIHKVEIQVNSNQDPSRIAKATFDVIKDVSLNPRTSAFDPNAQFKYGRNF